MMSCVYFILHKGDIHPVFCHPFSSVKICLSWHDPRACARGNSWTWALATSAYVVLTFVGVEKHGCNIRAVWFSPRVKECTVFVRMDRRGRMIDALHIYLRGVFFFLLKKRG